jgi:hypothetical protein
MRTTLSLDDDALSVARALAKQRRISLGKAVSELVRKAARQPLLTERRGDLEIIKLPEGSPTVTGARVAELLEDLP